MSVKSFISVAALAAVTVGCMQSTASASIVLTVDVTNPTAVVFASTGAPALATRSGLGDGLLVTGLFTGGPFNQGTFLPGDLRSTQGTFSYASISATSGGLFGGFGNQT